MLRAVIRSLHIPASSLVDESPLVSVYRPCILCCSSVVALLTQLHVGACHSDLLVSLVGAGRHRLQGCNAARTSSAVKAR
jgi:hypothetical protein